ncbi:MAG: hypothetical protein KAV00_03305 [Phycisphaerae bacterium]|nr:hypothetical protein [Phycisphaerae bacterium]
MPKVIFTGLVEKISGKMSGSTLKGVKSGSLLRRRQTTRQPRSAKQQETRGLYNAYAGKWYALSDTQKATWNKYASLLPGAMSGFNAYLQLNIHIRKANHAGLTEISTPPPVPSTPEALSGLDAVPASGQVTVTWSAPSDAATWVQVYFAPEVGFSFKDKEKWSMVETVRADVGQVIHTHDYPTTTPMLYRARSIDAFGRISPYSHTTYGATPGAHYGEDYYGGGYYA